jgi:hypothetical protein
MANVMMSPSTRIGLLRANAVFLLVASASGMINDLIGAFLLRGPVGLVVEKAPHAAIGFVEAHGLAFIIGILLWRAEPSRLWHATAVAVHLLLGTSNLMFWPLFAFADIMMVGYVTTALHGVFAVSHLVAALCGGSRVTNAA